MRLPFVTRFHHQTVQELLLAQVEGLQSIIKYQESVIEAREREIGALTEILTNQKCNNYTSQPTEKHKNSDPIVSGRGGWRGMSQKASESTLPVAQDSITKLEMKVKKEGGNTDAL